MKKCFIVLGLLMIAWTLIMAMTAMVLFAPIPCLVKGKVYDVYFSFFGKLITKLIHMGDALIKEAEEEL